MGKTTKMLDPFSLWYSADIPGDPETEPGVYDYATSQSMFHYRENMPSLYYVVYSGNPAATSKKLEEAFHNLESPGGYDFSEDESYIVAEKYIFCLL